MKRIVFAFVFALLGITSALAQSPNVPKTKASIAIEISTATTTRLVLGITSQQIYVTSFNVVAAGTGNIQLISGTGATCGTGTVNVTGNYNLTAQQGLAQGTGVGAILVVGSGLSLCAVTSANVGMPGSLSYDQF